MPLHPSKRLLPEALPEALPGAAWNKDELNKAGGLGRGRGGWSKGSSRTRCQQSCSSQSHGCWRQAGEQRPGSCAHSSPQQAGTSSRIQRNFSSHWSHPTRRAEHCRLVGRGGVIPHLHPLSYLQSNPIQLEAISARHTAWLAMGM